MTLTYGGWDTHSDNFKTLRQQLPNVDRGVSNLIQDLHDRGMQDDVVTVMWGEFGRTPKINGNNGGRDHWSPAMSALVAGGGLKMGQAIGATSAGASTRTTVRTKCRSSSARCTRRSASIRRRRSPTAAAGRCTSSMTAIR